MKKELTIGEADALAREYAGRMIESVQKYEAIEAAFMGLMGDYLKMVPDHYPTVAEARVAALQDPLIKDAIDDAPFYRERARMYAAAHDTLVTNIRFTREQRARLSGRVSR